MKNLYKFKINYTFKGGVFEDYGILNYMISDIESNTEPSFKVKIPRWNNKKEWMSKITEVIKINKIIEEIQFDTASYNTNDIVDIANNFADIIRTNNTITNLFINYYNFGSQGTSLLADALLVNNTITDLTLSNNRIEGEGFKKLIDVLRTNNTIIKLNLEGNDINDDVVIHLADALLDNNTLTHLSLKSKGTESYFPKFGNDGILALAITLTTNTSITYLDIRDHNITQLPSQLSQNISITEFLYTGNPIDYIPPNVFFWLDRFQIQQDNTIAQDNQNVHNRKIQQSTLISYHNIINATPGIPSKDELTEIIKNHPTMKDIEDFDEELKNFN